MKTILFLTDFSESAERALAYATEVARLFHAKMVLFYAVSDSYASTQPPVEPLQFDGKEKIEERITKLATQISIAVPCEYVINIGFTEDEISELVKDHQIDLAVIGSSIINDALDVSINLIKTLMIPVLVIPDYTFFKPITKIAFAVDLKTSLSPDSIMPLIDFASLMKAEVLVLNIMGDIRAISPECAAEGIKLESLLEQVPYSMHVLRNKNIIEGIENFIEVTRADMLALVSRKHTFLDSLFHKSITKEIASRPPVPMLALVE